MIVSSYVSKDIISLKRGGHVLPYTHIYKMLEGSRIQFIFMHALYIQGKAT